jgi:hypothetical protein
MLVEEEVVVHQLDLVVLAVEEQVLPAQTTQLPAQLTLVVVGEDLATKVVVVETEEQEAQALSSLLSQKTVPCRLLPQVELLLRPEVIRSTHLLHPVRSRQ